MPDLFAQNAYVSSAGRFWFVLLAFALGGTLGSFMNVVVYRLPRRMSLSWPGSHCPHCGKAIRWHDNVPIFGWLWLGGKCRDCRAPISPRYVLVELLTAALFLACLKRFGWSYDLVPALVLVTLLVPLTFIDLEHWLLPFAITLPGIAVGIALQFQLGLDAVMTSAIGAAAGWIAFFLLEILGEKVFKKEALGGGDKYLLALLGAFLGSPAQRPRFQTIQSTRLEHGHKSRRRRGPPLGKKHGEPDREQGQHQHRNPESPLIKHLSKD